MNGWKYLLLFGYRLLFWLPLSFVVCFWLFYFRATLHLGHTPRFSIDDPKYLGLDVWYHLVGFSFGLTIPAIVIVIPLLLLKFFFRKIPLWNIDLVVYACGFLLTVLVFFSDALTWYAD